jgi:uncharacterized membrane protein YeiB
VHIESSSGAVLRGGPARVSAAAATGRILGLDLARGLAILGMLAAHTVPGDSEAVYDGRSSVLFAVLAGVSLGLMTGGASPHAHPDRPRDRASVLIRGLFLLGLGLLLWQLETPIAIILDSYGLLFIAAIPVLFAPRRVLVLLALFFAFAGPVIVRLMTDAAAGLETASASAPGLTAIAAPLEWFTAYYAAPVWIAYVLAGLALARSGVTRLRTQLVTLGGGIVSAIAGYGIAAALGTPVTAHDDSSFEVFGAGGVAFAAIGALVWLTNGAPAALRRAAAVALRPLWSAGSMPLSLYTAQILTIAITLDVLDVDGHDFGAWQSVRYFVCVAAASLVAATLWRIRFVQGPLEWLLARLSLRRPWRPPVP